MNLKLCSTPSPSYAPLSPSLSALVIISITALVWHWDLIQWFYCIASHQMATFVFGCSWQLMLAAATWNVPPQPAHSSHPAWATSAWRAPPQLRPCCIWSSLGRFHCPLQCNCLLDQRLNVAFATEQSLGKLMLMMMMMKLPIVWEGGFGGGALAGLWANEEGSKSAGNLYFGPTLLPVSISMALWKTLLTDFIAFSLPLFAVPATATAAATF